MPKQQVDQMKASKTKKISDAAITRWLFKHGEKKTGYRFSAGGMRIPEKTHTRKRVRAAIRKEKPDAS